MPFAGTKIGIAVATSILYNSAGDAATLALDLDFKAATITSTGAPSAATADSIFDPTLTWTNPANHRMQCDRYGELQYAPHNLFTYSEDFSNAAWVKTGGSIDENVIANPVNGAVDADLLTENSSNSEHSVYQSNTGRVDEGVAIYAKPNGRDWICIRVQISSTWRACSFNITTGALGTTTGFTNVSMTDAGDGWYLLKCKATDRTHNLIQVQLMDADNSVTYLGNGSSGAYIWGAHLRQTPSPDTYIATTTAAVFGARAGTDNRKPVTNLALYPENLDNAVWSSNNTSVSTGQDDPFGGTNAIKLIEDGATSTHILTQLIASDLPSGKPETLAFYAKAGERNWVYIKQPSISNSAAYFDLTNGVEGTIKAGVIGYGIAEVPNYPGWYRIWAQYTSDGDDRIEIGLASADNTQSYTGDGSSGAYIFGAMLNEGGITDYVGSHNIILDTDADGDKVFSGWSGERHAISSDSTVAPDGTMTADTLGDDSSTGTGTVACYQAVTIETSQKHRYLMYAKPAQLDWIRLSVTGQAGQTIRQDFDLTNVALGTIAVGADNDDSGIVYFKNGYCLCWVDFTSDSSDTSAYVNAQPLNGDNDQTVDLDGTSDIHIWGAQLTKVGSDTSLDIPFCGMPMTGYVLDGYKGEPTATNRCAESDDLSTTWFIQGANSVTLTADQGVGPDNLATLYKVEITDTTNERHAINYALSTTSGTDYIFSGYVRADEQRYVSLLFHSSTENFAVACYDLYAGTVTATDTGTTSGTLNDYGIIPCGDGLYRIWQSSSTTVTGTSYLIIETSNTATPTYTGDGTLAYAGTAGDAFYAGGVQIETGTYPTSLIKTDGGTATRTGDDLTTTLSGFGFNEVATTWVVDATYDFLNGDTLHLMEAGDSSDSHRIAVTSAGAPDFLTKKTSSANGQATGTSSNSSPGVRQIYAMSAEQDNLVGAVTMRSSVVEDTDNVNLPTIAAMNDTLSIGVEDNGTSQWQGSIHTLKNYKVATAEADLLTFTEITDPGTAWKTERAA